MRPTYYPEFIYGLHESGGEQLMLRAERRGWVLELAAIGLDGSSTPADFSKLADAGLGVIVRINHGYGSTGTLPLPDKYPDFAAACATYVGRSVGCHLWIIGNEPNHRDEHPDGRAILPTDYANAYRLCRNAIRALPGHEEDQVLVAGPAPWNATTTYVGNEKGDWVRYFINVMALLPDDGCDGFALHTYTHFLEPRQITGDYFQGAKGYEYLRNEFRTYLDWMNAIPDRFRKLPVFLTETDPTTRGIGWNPGHNVGWVRAAYREIAEWNSKPENQPILALILYRWPVVPDQPEWSISNRGGIIEDFNQALKLEPSALYRLRMPKTVEPPTIYEPGAMLASDDQWTGVVATTVGLNQRTGPSTQHAILQLLPDQAEMMVLAEMGDWLYVNALSTFGYVNGSFVSRQRIGGFMPFVTSGGGNSTGTGKFLRERKDLMAAPLAPSKEEQIVIDPKKATLVEYAVTNAWNQYGALVTRIAEMLEIDPAVALAVMAIESGGRAFTDDGRMLIRFEPHIFYEEWGKYNQDRFNQHFRFDPNKIWEGHQWRRDPGQPWRDFHGNQNAEWEIFDFVRNALSPEAGMRSTSMGAPQIMGFNHERVGYPTAKAMFEAFSGSAHAQLIALFDFINADPARLNALRTGDYTTFASSYNGPGQAAHFAALIQEGVSTFNRLRATTSSRASSESIADKGEGEIQENNMENPMEPTAVTQPVPTGIQSYNATGNNTNGTGDSTGKNPDGHQTGEDKEGEARLPVPPRPGNLAEIDPEMYAAWRLHVLDGFANNQKMFEQLVNAFMGPYHTTVQLYRLTFLVGIVALVAAALLSAYTGQLMFGLLFGGISVAAFISYFITRPLRALEENLNFITWLGVIYNSYWTRLVYAMTMETVQQDIASITDDFTKQMQELLDKSAAMHKDRPGID